ncbi:hypothetical protein DL768_005525 [Monosporascus sp. mg162]|nr:hypothetical protein DL768_005525 [Monosporascus sp. mg162]
MFDDFLVRAGDPTAPPIATKPTTTKKAPTGPTPTQDGILSHCQRYHLAVAGATCQGIVEKYGAFSLANLKIWNPTNADFYGQADLEVQPDGSEADAVHSRLRLQGVT